MNRKWQLICVFVTAGACAGQAALIAGWNFNSQATGTAPTTISADHGAGSLDLSQLANATDANIGSGGTTVNIVSGDLAGNDFFVRAGSSQRENGQSIFFSLSTTGYKDIVLTYATDGTSTGFTSQQWSYSTDGVNYISFDSAIVVPSSFTAEEVNFSSVTSLNNASNIYFELTLGGATGSTGSDHFDNFQFNADVVPEPAAWGVASGALLLVLCGFDLLRQRASRTAFVAV